MYRLATKEFDNERKNLFINTSLKKKLNPAIIEKDYWVCLILDYLFKYSDWKEKIAFKGGTSLSKAYNLIERFSEDIDLILDWREIGYKINEPWETRSNTKQLKFLEDSKIRLFEYLKNSFMPKFKSELEAKLGRELNIFINEDDAGTICFEYPAAFSNNSILKIIRLEIGALASWTPTQKTTIISYAAEEYPKAFFDKESEIITTTVARTFWEKATILHQEALRPVGSIIPSRYSRHYYDIYCLSNSYAKTDALSQPELLEKVADFKAKFYPRNWARYDLARSYKTLKLYPAPHSLEALRKDYENMSEMIYGNKPDFDELLEFIKKLEFEINSKF